MRCHILVIGLLLSSFTQAQTVPVPVPLSTLPPFDCNLKKWMNLSTHPIILVAPDQQNELKEALDEYYGYLGNHCERRTVGQMTDADYYKPLFIIGKMADLPHWNKFRLPIKRINRGFEINGTAFTDTSDGFSFVDSEHVVISGNSLSAIKDVQFSFTPGYDITILHKGKVTYFGNYTDDKFTWYNLQNLKTANYNKQLSRLFDGIYISKTFRDSINIAKTESALNQYARQFLSIYNLPVPKTTIDWFIHTNMQEYGMMSGMFNLACPGNGSAGFTIRNEIHTRGYNLPLVKHEYSHYLFNNNIPLDHNPAFFVEGSVEYVTALNDTATYNERLKIARQFKDTLNYEDLIVRDKDFYGQYSGTNYSICGVFVKYLVDTYGVESFKAYCLAPNKLEASKKHYQKEFPALISDYKAWLAKQ